MDMVDETNCIWDWKTQGKKSQIHAGLQNWIYSKIYEEKWGVKPSFKYCCFILTKNPSIEIQTIESIQDYSILDRYVNAYLKGVEHEVFLPASSYDFLCSESACPFYWACEYKTNQK